MTEYTELKPLLEACRAEYCDGPREFRKAVEALFDVCTVETISALIAENERLAEEYDKAWRHDLNDKKNVQALSGEVARLSTENEALCKAALAAREFIMHEAEVRGFLDESNEVSFRHPRRQAAIATIDAAMGKGEPS